MTEETTMAEFTWEVKSVMQEGEKGEGKSMIGFLSRAKVPGGWIVSYIDVLLKTGGLTFYPDPKHEWDGGTL
jgi:hypothetical protein